MHHSQLGLSVSRSVTTAIVLAGGLGTRLRDTVPDLPKPMAPVNGRPFLEFQLDFWIRQGVDRFILSVGYRSEAIIAHFGASYRTARVEFAVEEAPLGTGGGLLLAAERLADRSPFLLLNGDTFFEVKLADLTDFHTARVSDWTFSLFRTNESGRYMGMDVDVDGRIDSLRSGAGRSGQYANGGVYLVNPEILQSTAWRAQDKLSLEDDLLPALFAASARLYGREFAGRFIDIGVPDDYLRCAAFLDA